MVAKNAGTRNGDVKVLTSMDMRCHFWTENEEQYLHVHLSRLPSFAKAKAFGLRRRGFPDSTVFYVLSDSLAFPGIFADSRFAKVIGNKASAFGRLSFLGEFRASNLAILIRT
jgi:hypothetical protein